MSTKSTALSTARAVTYISDESDNVLIVSRDGGGDFLVGVQHRADGINYGSHSVRFRRANGGASQHPRLISALAELEAALAEIRGDSRGF